MQQQPRRYPGPRRNDVSRHCDLDKRAETAGFVACETRDSGPRTTSSLRRRHGRCDGLWRVSVATITAGKTLGATLGERPFPACQRPRKRLLRSPSAPDPLVASGPPRNRRCGPLVGVGGEAAGACISGDDGFCAVGDGHFSVAIKQQTRGSGVAGDDAAADGQRLFLIVALQPDDGLQVGCPQSARGDDDDVGESDRGVALEGLVIDGLVEGAAVTSLWGTVRGRRG